MCFLAWFFLEIRSGSQSDVDCHLLTNTLAVLGPLVLPTNLLLLLGSEVVGDVESLSDLLRGLALDHVGHGLASDIQEGLDVEIVGSLVAR